VVARSAPGCVTCVPSARALHESIRMMIAVMYRARRAGFCLGESDRPPAPAASGSARARQLGVFQHPRQSVRGEPGQVPGFTVPR